ncbi:MAG: hypothetical protein FWC64_12380 [Treponema sp.]|nr:hypothetical protein [Treponema sp.]
MKKTFKLLGIVALTAIIGFPMTACGGTNGGGGDGGPTIPPIVNLTPDAIPISDNPAFTNPGAGGQTTVAANDMDEVLELLIPVIQNLDDFLIQGFWDYADDNIEADSFTYQLQNVTFSPPLITAGISNLTGSVSISSSPTSFTGSWNNVNYVYRSYQATSPWFQVPSGTTIVASGRMSISGGGWESGSSIYDEEAMSVSFAAAFQTPNIFGRAVINVGVAGRNRETADGDWEDLSLTAYAVVYLFDSNNAQVHRYEAATVERAMEIWSGSGWNGYAAPIGVEAGLELPNRASRWLRGRR